MDDVVGVLACEQRALERLLFRLHHARVVLAADDERFLSMAADELEDAAYAVRELEAARTRAVSATAPDTLRAIADAAPEPYAELLHAHRAALGRLAGEVGAMIETTEMLAADRLAEVRGERSAQLPRSRRVRVHTDDLDRACAAAGYESVLAASSSLRLPSLVSFLG